MVAVAACVHCPRVQRLSVEPTELGKNAQIKDDRNEHHPRFGAIDQRLRRLLHWRGSDRHAFQRQRSGATVTFEPRARTAWHTHPLGQTLIVTSGLGWVQAEGGPKREVRAGDIVWIPPGEKHWHGATATTAMRHIAVAKALNCKTVDWMEKVSDAQFGQ
jgi:quercetin dioxygenase-like cupin family protein